MSEFNLKVIKLKDNLNNNDTYNKTISKKSNLKLNNPNEFLITKLGTNPAKNKIKFSEDEIQNYSHDKDKDNIISPTTIHITKFNKTTKPSISNNSDNSSDGNKNKFLTTGFKSYLFKKLEFDITEGMRSTQNKVKSCKICKDVFFDDFSSLRSNSLIVDNRKNIYGPYIYLISCKESRRDKNTYNTDNKIYKENENTSFTKIRNVEEEFRKLSLTYADVYISSTEINQMPKFRQNSLNYQTKNSNNRIKHNKKIKKIKKHTKFCKTCEYSNTYKTDKTNLEKNISLILGVEINSSNKSKNNDNTAKTINNNIIFNSSNSITNTKKNNYFPPSKSNKDITKPKKGGSCSCAACIIF